MALENLDNHAPLAAPAWAAAIRAKKRARNTVATRAPVGEVALDAVAAAAPQDVSPRVERDCHSFAFAEKRTGSLCLISQPASGAAQVADASRTARLDAADEVGALLRWRILATRREAEERDLAWRTRQEMWHCKGYSQLMRGDLKEAAPSVWCGF
ncbi:hypothetical protein M885DRAFT_627066 [Pelagophyceae sp. CCMP2097]|nr:hypothetical protein M885DRAFT_627066 [Pelagophyceae sp. CCMP2097]